VGEKVKKEGVSALFLHARSSSTPVLQTRQKAKLSLVVKSYTEESKELSLAADAIDYITKNTNRARLKTAGERDKPLQITATHSAIT
jgi:hypothetical protein